MLRDSFLYRSTSPFQKSLPLVLFAGLWSQAGHGQSGFELKDSIDNLINNWNRTEAPGISIAVIKEGHVIYSRSLGMANIKTKTRNDSTTTFWIASVTKQFTAAAIYQLAVEKKIRLNASVRAYLPQLPPLFNGVTIDHLIHHTSGIRDGFVLTALSKKPPSQYTNENVINALKASAGVNFAPGSRFEYNNSGYVLLATVIEKVSGKSYPTYMKDMIFQPLGMNNTYVSAAFPTNADQAEGYQETEAHTFTESHFEGNTYGSSGIITTLPDLTRWCQFVQRPSRVPALASITEHLLKTGRFRNGQQMAYAGGLERFVYGGRTVFEHFGADEGFKADVLYFPETKVSIVGLTNNSSFFGLIRLLCTVADYVQDGRASAQPAINERETMISEGVYYNADEPRMVQLKDFAGYATISSTLSGYAAPYRKIGDTLESLDPFPTSYIRKESEISVFNAYYNDFTRLKALKPLAEKNDLSGYTGEYFSNEINASYRITATEKGLQFEFMPGMTFDLFRITKRDFQFDFLGPNFIQFTNNGFTFSREGCRKLPFMLKRQRS